MPTVQVYLSDELYEWYLKNHPEESLSEWVRKYIKRKMEASEKKGGKNVED